MHKALPVPEQVEQFASAQQEPLTKVNPDAHVRQFVLFVPLQVLHCPLQHSVTLLEFVNDAPLFMQVKQFPTFGPLQVAQLELHDSHKPKNKIILVKYS